MSVGSSAGRGQRRPAGIACGHEVTAAAARQVLDAGGNAFDAAVAGACAACVAEPVLASLGGGGYLLAGRDGSAPRVYDFFVDTPRHRRQQPRLDLHPIDADFGSVTQEFHIGLGAAATPGMVAGLCAVHRDLCRLPMTQLVDPAVQAARHGVEVNPLQAYIFQVVAPIYTATTEARAIYGADRDSLPQAGQRFRQPQLAETFERLAAEGADLFYGGELGRRLVQICAEQGGQLREEDLQEYRVTTLAPLAVDYRQARVSTSGPPSRGGMLIAFALALLADTPALRDGDRLRALARAMRCANEARAQRDSRILEKGLLDRYRAELRARPGASRGTTHLSVMDREGNFAALSLSNGEGCGHLLPGTGVMLNNMLGEADLNPDGLQRWAPGVRMASMMAPTFVEWPGHRAVLGSGGSNRIRSAILQVITNLVDRGMTAQQAVNAPRIHVEGGLISIEGGIEPAEESALAELGLDIERWQDRNLFFGGAHLLLQDAAGLQAAGDPRRGGVGLTC